MITLEVWLQEDCTNIETRSPEVRLQQDCLLLCHLPPLRLAPLRSIWTSSGLGASSLTLQQGRNTTRGSELSEPSYFPGLQKKINKNSEVQCQLAYLLPCFQLVPSGLPVVCLLEISIHSVHCGFPSNPSQRFGALQAYLIPCSGNSNTHSAFGLPV